jgi:phage terminase large subunit GpA-like protein
MIIEAVRNEVERMVARVWRKREARAFIPWCRENIVIKPTENPDYAGPYDPGPVLPMARLWELWLDDPEWRELHIAKGSQSAATAHSLMAITRAVAEAPRNVLYAIHSATEAANISRRLRAFLEGCLAASGILEETPDDDKTTLALRLPGMNCWLIGAHSAGAMASKPGLGLVVIDEVDKHPRIPGEAPTIDLMRQRMKTIQSGKLVSFSTPTHEGGQIWGEVLSGTRHRYFVPCPVCGHFQWLQPSQLRFEHLQDLAGGFDLEEVRRETHYECESCKGAIREESKVAMLEAGEWRATNFREGPDGEQVPAWQPGRMSAHISDLYSTWGKSGWGDIAVERIEARGNSGKLHALLNNRFGEPWKQSGGQEVEERHVLNLRHPYKRGHAPFEPVYVGMAADTQDDCWKWGIGAWDKNGDMAVVDYGQVFAFRDILERAKEGVPWHGKGYLVQTGLVDEGGHRTREVRRNVVNLRPWFFACKGRGGVQARSTIEWKDHGVDHEGLEKVPVLHFDDDGFRRMLYREMILRGVNADGKKLMLPVDAEMEFMRELCAEQLVMETDGAGVKKWGWKRTGCNDYGDVVKMLLVLWAAAGHLVMGKG